MTQRHSGLHELCPVLPGHEGDEGQAAVGGKGHQRLEGTDTSQAEFLVQGKAPEGHEGHPSEGGCRPGLQLAGGGNQPDINTSAA